ncbi:hypothetical protein E1A91_A10G232000v1, partial [Gossypium mustelinum]
WASKRSNLTRPNLFSLLQEPNFFSAADFHLTQIVSQSQSNRENPPFTHLFAVHFSSTKPITRPREKMASKSEGKEPVNEQVVANMYGAMRSELNQIYSKITELEMEVSEHSLVINAIQPLDQSRRCYRMIGGVLVERTIKEVLPAVQRNKEGLEEVIARLNETLEKKKKEIADFETKYKIRIKKSDNDSKDESNKKEGSAQGVLVGPASSSE